MGDVSSTIKTDETLARGWLRGLASTHPFTAIGIGIVLGMVIGYLIAGVL